MIDKSVLILNYGVGNLKAISDVCEILNFDPIISNNPCELKSAKKIILPGVGSFDWAVSKLNNSGLRKNLETSVIKYQVPVLGICVGMQMLLEKSEEGNLEGLGWIEGNSVHFDKIVGKQFLPIPHMGWNTVDSKKGADLFKGIETAEFYFLHSYSAKTCHEINQIATSHYGDFFSSSIGKDNIFGVQFHPEKSHQNGICLMKNFLEI